MVSPKVAQNLDYLIRVDYRVRTQIRECLEINYSKNQNQPFAGHIAFQLAFCYHVGLGVKLNDNTCHMWLDKSDKQPKDLKAEENAVQPARWKNSYYNEGLVSVDLIHEYRTWGLRALDQAREECEDSLAIWHEYLARSTSYYCNYTQPLEICWMNSGNCPNQKRYECGSESKSKRQTELIIHITFNR